MAKRRSLRSKISFTIMVVATVLLVCAAAVLSITIKDFSDLFDSSNRKMGNTSSFMSSSFMGMLTQRHMKETAADKAEIVDGIFLDFEQSVRVAADAAEHIYDNPELYSPRPVPPPLAENDGVLTVQVLYASDTDPEDPAVRDEASLLGNVQDTLLAVNKNSRVIASNYIATESGIMIQADLISGKKFDEAGNLLPLNAKERPWYQGAESTGRLYLTPVTRDLHTPRLGIMCGIPIFHDGRFVAVSGAGMYLDDVDALVQSVDVGENGSALIVNQDGQILFSTLKEGSLSVEGSVEDLRFSENSALAGLVSRALLGETGSNRITIDGVPCYVAFAPMKTVDWSFLIIMSQNEVDAPIEQMQSSLDHAAELANEKASDHISHSMVMLLLILIGAGVLSLLASLVLSRRILKPIRKLTDSVSRLQGDDLDFQWDTDTGDETQLLAASFQSLTERMKTYISDIQDITAEKERIGAELNIANQIQASMMPSIFPAFPEHTEFDVYAAMTPAKEVGGDFYDFFLIDDDHLGLVMADVSGKGIPAALFMMATKIILANNTMNIKSPAEVLEATNNAICSNNREEMFVTVWLGILDLKTGMLTAANAGHEYPAIRRAGGSFELLRDRHGFVVGGMAGMKYKNYEIQLAHGDELFLYTDGVPEASNAANEQFGTDRMLSALNGAASEDPRTILDAVQQSVDCYVGDAPQFDDLTMLCLRYLGDHRNILTLEAKLDNLDQVLSFVGDALDEAGCPLKTRMMIELSVEELFVNIASYAYAPGTGDAEIGVTVRGETREAVITLADSGVPYNILGRADPDVTLSAEERQIGGLGIYMVKKSMDEVRYAYRNGQNITTIIKKL